MVCLLEIQDTFSHIWSLILQFKSVVFHESKQGELRFCFESDPGMWHGSLPRCLGSMTCSQQCLLVCISPDLFSTRFVLCLPALEGNRIISSGWMWLGLSSCIAWVLNTFIFPFAFDSCVDATTFLYFSFFAPLIYVAFLKGFFGWVARTGV